LEKIAVESCGDLAATSNGHPEGRLLAKGNGWSVYDVVCTLGPRDKPFPERHNDASIALVVSGTFLYRSLGNRELMTPGSFFLGSPGQSFECGHEHGQGDRCLSFSYEPELFDRLAHDAGARIRQFAFKSLRLPPLRALSRVAVAAFRGLASPDRAPWEEICLALAARAIRLDRGLAPGQPSAQPSAIAQVTRIVRSIEHNPDDAHRLSTLAAEARLSPYHFLRTFQCVTGVTPHQYLLRSRLRIAAVRLVTQRRKVVDVAFSSGFGDVSNFNRMFRAEFGATPRSFQTDVARI